ncbi:MAG: hypothetical protein ACPGJV_07095 [Bacteriovoracaceae bacterium]
MKQLMGILTIGLLVLTGCGKDNETSADTPVDGQNNGNNSQKHFCSIQDPQGRNDLRRETRYVVDRFSLREERGNNLGEMERTRLRFSFKRGVTVSKRVRKYTWVERDPNRRRDRFNDDFFIVEDNRRSPDRRQDSVKMPDYTVVFFEDVYRRRLRNELDKQTRLFRRLVRDNPHLKQNSGYFDPDEAIKVRSFGPVSSDPRRRNEVMIAFPCKAYTDDFLLKKTKNTNRPRR